MKLIELNRVTKDIGIFGPKGSFKTTTAVLIGALEKYFYNTKIYSNMKDLKYPHIYCDSIEKVKNLIGGKERKLFIGDDFERWFFSRNWSKNYKLTDILLDWGKMYCSVLYTAKREKAIDIGLVDSTQEFWYIIPKLHIRSNTGDIQIDRANNNILKRYANFIYLKIKRFDQELEEINPIKIYNLPYIFKLFDTSEQVKEVKIE